MNKSIPTKQIDGDVAVGRNVTTGGKVTVRGSARVGHNLRVDGWLDAPNIKGPAKGMFVDEASLREAYPEPENGWWAIVGTSMPGQIYQASGGDWVCTGTTGGTIIVDSGGVSDLMERMDSLEDNDFAQDGAIAKISGDLSNLSASRGTASGLATLDGSGHVPRAQLPGDVPAVLPFYGTVANPAPTLHDEATGTVGAVKYHNGAFVLSAAVIGGSGAPDSDLYTRWGDAEHSISGGPVSVTDTSRLYGSASDKGRVPYRDKVYLDMSDNGRPYVWTGTALVPATHPGEVLPFDGTQRAGAAPGRGIRFSAGAFRFNAGAADTLNRLGLTRADYNEGADTDIPVARTDRLYRCGAELYGVVDGELRQIGALGHDGHSAYPGDEGAALAARLDATQIMTYDMTVYHASEIDDDERGTVAFAVDEGLFVVRKGEGHEPYGPYNEPAGQDPATGVPIYRARVGRLYLCAGKLLYSSLLDGRVVMTPYLVPDDLSAIAADIARTASRQSSAGILPIDGVLPTSGAAPTEGVWYDEARDRFVVLSVPEGTGYTEADYNYPATGRARMEPVYRCGGRLYRVNDKDAGLIEIGNPRVPQLFVDMWCEAGRRAGGSSITSYDQDGETFYVYQEPLDYGEALPVLMYHPRWWREVPGAYAGKDVRVGLIPLHSAYGSRYDISSVFNGCTQLETAVLSTNVNQGIEVSSAFRSFYNCKQLTSISPTMKYVPFGGNIPQYVFAYCEALEEVRLYQCTGDPNLRWSPRLSRESVASYVNSYVAGVPVSFTVHPDVFAKLNSDLENPAAAATPSDELDAWMELLLEASEKQISFIQG